MIYKEQKPGVCTPDKIDKLMNPEETGGCDDDEKIEKNESDVIIREPRKSKESNEEYECSGNVNNSYFENNEQFQYTEIPSTSAMVEQKPKLSEVVPTKIEKPKESITEPEIPAMSNAEEKPKSDKAEVVTMVQLKQAGHIENTPVQKIMNESKDSQRFNGEEKIDLQSEAVIVTQPRRIKESFEVIESIDGLKNNYHNTSVHNTLIANASAKEVKLESDTFESVKTVQAKKIGEPEELSAMEPMDDEQDYNDDDDDELSEFTQAPAMSGEEEKRDPDKFEVETPELPRKTNTRTNLPRSDSYEIEYGCVSRYIIMVCSWNDYAVPVIFAIPILLAGACSYSWSACLPCAIRNL